MRHSGPSTQVQFPALHSSDVAESHAFPPEPQLASLVCVVTQLPAPHCSLPPVQVRPHSPQFAIVFSG